MSLAALILAFVTLQRLGELVLARLEDAHGESRAGQRSASATSS